MWRGYVEGQRMLNEESRSKISVARDLSRSDRYNYTDYEEEGEADELERYIDAPIRKFQNPTL
jgi:hypothetical protein